MDIETALRDRGRRVTRPRRLVWRVLEDSEVHLSAQQIVERVNEIDPAINRSSVYRVLSVLADLGLVRESRLAGADHPAATWEITHGDDVIHLVCSACGAVQHHETGLIEQLRRSLGNSPRFCPDSIDVRVTGCCRSCGRSPSMLDRR